ncbi:MAG: hypothetical protein ACLGIF_11415, partial [Actinomycetes bacterium]
MFDDSWLDDRQALAAADPVLRRLAEAGARLRRENEEGRPVLHRLRDLPRPRAVVATGAEARFIRAILEPVCPVPFVAWPTHGLPGWVGALDLVVVMASERATPGLVATVHEAVRRGAQVVVACPQPSTIAEHAASRSSTVLPTCTADPLAAAIVMLAGLHEMALGPEVNPDEVADALDAVAEDCSPYADVSINPAKDLAMGLADAQPLVWGGSVLAARASRRVAEALRAATGRTALAADADALLPTLDLAAPRDPFADPYEDGLSADRRPCVVHLDDGNTDDLVRSSQARLLAAAERNDIRVCTL